MIANPIFANVEKKIYETVCQKRIVFGGIQHSKTFFLAKGFINEISIIL